MHSPEPIGMAVTLIRLPPLVLFSPSLKLLVTSSIQPCFSEPYVKISSSVLESAVGVALLGTAAPPEQPRSTATSATAVAASRARRCKPGVLWDGLAIRPTWLGTIATSFVWIDRGSRISCEGYSVMLFG